MPVAFFIIIVIVNANCDLDDKAGKEMTVSRACRTHWVLAASWLLAGSAAVAARAPNEPRRAAAVAPTAPTAVSTTAASATAAPAHLSHGRFKDLRVYLPTAPAASFAILLSDDDGWTTAADDVARQLVQRGAMVAGVDLAKFRTRLQADGDQCEFPDGDLENLSHFVQAYEHVPTYLSPTLVGVGAGGTFAYAMLAQAPRNTFAAALSLGFCPNFAMGKPLCKGSGVEFTSQPPGRGVTFLPVRSLGNPWVVLQSSDDRRGAEQACSAAATHAFVSKVNGAAMATLPRVGPPQYTAAYDALATRNPTSRVAPPPASLSDLPVIEVPAQPQTSTAPDLLAILMSGDGGWAGLDQDVAGALAAKGIPVVGLDSLRYFWTPRAPQGLADDMDRLIRYYVAHFHKHRVLLIGYSQGADVLPFALNRLPDPTRAQVGLLAVMGMSEHALFEFHLTSWVSDDNSGPATLPEINRIRGLPVLCIYGEDEKDSLCPKLDPAQFNIVKLKGGHHFDGDYAGLAREIISSVKP